MQAVGAVIAIFAAIAISNFQIVQQQRQTKRDAADETWRVFTLAHAVVSEALETILQVESSQRKWPDGVAYQYLDQSRVQAAKELLTMVLREPLFRELLQCVMQTYQTVLKVDTQAVQLIGIGNAARNSRFDLGWQQRKRDVVRTVSSMAKAKMEAKRVT